MKAIKVHCGSAHVHGKARNYRYFVASLFEVRQTRDGRKVQRNKKTVAGPFRSFDKTVDHARAACETHNASFIEGYGSLHNIEVQPTDLDCR